MRSIAVATLDVFVNLYFSLLFAVPLYRGTFSNRAVYRIALKSLIGATISMASTVSNSMVIVVLEGHEKSWVCLASCTVRLRDTLPDPKRQAV